jgi:Cdc6-like AAA superfamily ATPase
MPELLEFKKYNQIETKGILKERVDYAFVPGVFPDPCLTKVAGHAHGIGDIRSGLFLLKESATIAEDKSSKKIEDKDVDTAIEKMSSFKIKSSADLEDDTKSILDIIKENSGKKIGDLFKIYQEKGGSGVYKTFQRKISKLSDGKYITTKQVIGKQGNTTIVHYASNKKLDEF